MSVKTPIELEAILVGQSDYRESDRIVRLLSAEHGLIRAVARSARASRRRFGGSLDPGNKLSAILKRGRGELWHLDEVTLLDGRLRARADLDRLTLLAYACEAVASLARPDTPEPQLFGLLQVACLLIDGGPQPPGAMFRLALEAKALTFAGLTPALVRCVECATPLHTDGPWTFDPTRGGALHARCVVRRAVLGGCVDRAGPAAAFRSLWALRVLSTVFQWLPRGWMARGAARP